jgi:hypothetical protein
MYGQHPQQGSIKELGEVLLHIISLVLYLSRYFVGVHYPDWFATADLTLTFLYMQFKPSRSSIIYSAFC